MVPRLSLFNGAVSLRLSLSSIPRCSDIYVRDFALDLAAYIIASA